MTNWVKVQDAMPDTEIECLVAAREHDLIFTHKAFVRWDGFRWVDAEGEEVKDVIAWTKAPQYLVNTTMLDAVRQLEGCLDHDACDNEDCCYFAHPRAIEEVLKYIKEMEGIP